MSYLGYSINTALFAFLMSFRIGAFFRAMPFFAEIKVTVLIQILLPLLLAVLIAPHVEYNVLPLMSGDVLSIFLAIVTEVLTGIFMGYSVTLIMTLATMVGELTGMQAGFAMASIFDPNLGQVSILGVLIRNIFLLAFFIFNIHHSVIWILVQSYQSIPVGMSFISFQEAVPGLFRIFASIYLMSFRIVLPIIVIILLSHITMGIVSITAPQMNIYFNAAITMNFLVALFFFAISFPALFRFYKIALGSLEDFLATMVLAVP